MMQDRTPFCRRIRQARKEAGLKQETVARYLAIPVSAVSSFESGSRKVDALELYMLAKLYQKPVQWFFAQEDSPVQFIRGPRTEELAEDDPLVQQCIQMMRKAPPNLKRSAAYGVIGFLNSK